MCMRARARACVRACVCERFVVAASCFGVGVFGELCVCVGVVVVVFVWFFFFLGGGGGLIF